jgi:hypothetical protein
MAQPAQGPAQVAHINTLAATIGVAAVAEQANSQFFFGRSGLLFEHSYVPLSSVELLS